MERKEDPIAPSIKTSEIKQTFLARSISDMLNENLDYSAERFCPAYGKVITADLCYESLMCLNGGFKVSSTPELSEIDDIEAARERCAVCPYSDLE